MKKTDILSHLGAGVVGSLLAAGLTYVAIKPSDNHNHTGIEQRISQLEQYHQNVAVSVAEMDNNSLPKADPATVTHPIEKLLSYEQVDEQVEVYAKALANHVKIHPTRKSKTFTPTGPRTADESENHTEFYKEFEINDNQVTVYYKDENQNGSVDFGDKLEVRIEGEDGRLFWDKNVNGFISKKDWSKYTAERALRQEIAEIGDKPGTYEIKVPPKADKWDESQRLEVQREYLKVLKSLCGHLRVDAQ